MQTFLGASLLLKAVVKHNGLNPQQKIFFLTQKKSAVIVAKLVLYVLTVNMQHGLSMEDITLMNKTGVWADMVFSKKLMK